MVTCTKQNVLRNNLNAREIPQTSLSCNGFFHIEKDVYKTSCDEEKFSAQYLSIYSRAGYFSTAVQIMKELGDHFHNKVPKHFRYLQNMPIMSPRVSYNNFCGGERG